MASATDKTTRTSLFDLFPQPIVAADKTSNGVTNEVSNPLLVPSLKISQTVQNQLGKEQDFKQGTENFAQKVSSDVPSDTKDRHAIFVGKTSSGTQEGETAVKKKQRSQTSNERSLTRTNSLLYKTNGEWQNGRDSLRKSAFIDRQITPLETDSKGEEKQRTLRKVPSLSEIAQPQPTLVSPVLDRKNVSQSSPYNYIKSTKQVNGLPVQTTFNPLFGNTQVTMSPTVAEIKIKEKLPYFLDMSDKLIFNSGRAEKELSQCIASFPDYTATVASVISELQESFIKPKHNAKALERLHEVLVLALCKPKNLALIKAYADKTSVEILDKFAHKAVAYLIKNDEQYLKHIWSEFTRADLENQTRSTMFRGSHISSSLCKEYGCYLWANEMKLMDLKILKELSKYPDLWQLRLDYTGVSEMMGQQKDFPKKDGQEQGKLIQERLAQNAERFLKFASLVLPEIYYMEISDEFAGLLRTRRSHIIEFLQLHPVPTATQPLNTDDNSMESGSKPVDDESDPVECSKKYISELIFLRIINPHLGTKVVPPKSDPAKQRILLQLTMVIQCIANGTKFGEGKIPHFMLDPLIEDFRATHNEFIAKYTLPKSEKKQ